MSSEVYTLRGFLADQDETFKIQIAKDQDIDDMKELVKEKNDDILCAARLLQIYKIDQGTITEEKLLRHEENGFPDDIVKNPPAANNQAKLKGSKSISKCWSHQPQQERYRLHFIVALSEGAGALSTLQEAQRAVHDIGLTSPDRYSHLFMKLWPKEGATEAEQRRQQLLSQTFFEQNGLEWFDPSFIHPAFGNRKLVRSEYIEALSYIQQRFNRQADGTNPYNTAIVTGQPGIGKSVFMTYLLCRRVAAGLPTAWQTWGQIHLFGYTGPAQDQPPQFLQVSKEGELYRDVLTRSWCLVDGEHVITGTTYNLPCSAICPIPRKGVRLPPIVFSSSRKKSVFDSWTKDRPTTYFYMNPWSWEEVQNFSIHSNYQIAHQTLQARFYLVGGCIQQLLVTHEEEWQTYMDAVHSDILALDMDGLQRAIQQQIQRYDLGFSKLLYIFPRQHSPWRYEVGPGSAYIRDLILQRMVDLALADQTHLYHLFSGDNATRAVAGQLFEAIVHANHQTGAWILRQPSNPHIVSIDLPDARELRLQPADGANHLPQNANHYIRPSEITIAEMHTINQTELIKVWDMLPSWTHDVMWYFCFVGDDERKLADLTTKPPIHKLTQQWQSRLQFCYCLRPVPD